MPTRHLLAYANSFPGKLVGLGLMVERGGGVIEFLNMKESESCLMACNAEDKGSCSILGIKSRLKKHKYE